MRAPSLTSIREAPLTRRAVSMAAVVAVHALLLLLLLRAAPEFVPFVRNPGAPLMIDLLPSEREQAQRTETHRAQRQQRESRQQPPRRATPTAAPEAPVEAPSRVSGVWSQLLQLTPEEMARSDVAKLPKAATPGPQPADAGGGSRFARGDDQPVGTMPNGEPLYGAEWYREPTDAELATYAPAGVQGWGIIACRTAAGYRVEDCQELGQDPPGSGLSRAVREAAWQFRVVPPRVGGRPLTGTWVRIRIDYRIASAK